MVVRPARLSPARAAWGHRRCSQAGDPRLGPGPTPGGTPAGARARRWLQPQHVDDRRPGRALQGLRRPEHEFFIGRIDDLDNGLSCLRRQALEIHPRRHLPRPRRPARFQGLPPGALLATARSSIVRHEIFLRKGLVQVDRIRPIELTAPCGPSSRSRTSSPPQGGWHAITRPSRAIGMHQQDLARSRARLRSRLSMCSIHRGD